MRYAFVSGDVGKVQQWRLFEAAHEKVDAVLSKIPDEVNPTATGTSATPPVSAKANDAEGEVIAAANSLREKEPRLTMQKAMSRVLRKNPDLRKRASEQRASYKIPTEAP